MDIDRRVLLAARAMAGLSQGELASEARLHLNALQRIEAGGNMRASTLDRLLQALARKGVEVTADGGAYSGVRLTSRTPVGPRKAGPFRSPRPRKSPSAAGGDTA